MSANRKLTLNEAAAQSRIDLRNSWGRFGATEKSQLAKQANTDRAIGVGNEICMIARPSVDS